MPSLVRSHCLILLLLNGPLSWIAKFRSCSFQIISIVERWCTFHWIEISNCPKETIHAYVKLKGNISRLQRMFTLGRQFLVQIYFNGKTCTKIFLNACMNISFSISNIMLFLSMTIRLTHNCTHWSINMIFSMLFSPFNKW